MAALLDSVSNRMLCTIGWSLLLCLRSFFYLTWHVLCYLYFTAQLVLLIVFIWSPSSSVLDCLCPPKVVNKFKLFKRLLGLLVLWPCRFLHSMFWFVGKQHYKKVQCALVQMCTGSQSNFITPIMCMSHKAPWHTFSQLFGLCPTFWLRKMLSECVNPSLSILPSSPIYFSAFFHIYVMMTFIDRSIISVCVGFVNHLRSLILHKSPSPHFLFIIYHVVCHELNLLWIILPLTWRNYVNLVF